MRFALAQINPIVGDIEGNGEKILVESIEAVKKKATIILTPELSLLGYPPKDLLLNPFLFEKEKTILDKISKKLYLKAPKATLIVGIAEAATDSQIPSLFNSVVAIKKGNWEIIARKQLLPSYDIFDERRYFRPSRTSSIFKTQFENKLWKLGITICEDLWVEEKIQGKRIKGQDPIEKFENKGIDVLINLSASPYSHYKYSVRQEIAAQAAKRLNCPVIYLNQVGGNDELIFDGSSFITNTRGEVDVSLPTCKEALTLWDPTTKPSLIQKKSYEPQERLFQALVLGVKDYVKKCHFSDVLIGLSGGIDSALVTTIACAALGPKHVHTVLMPSPWSSPDSITDAEALASRLRISTRTIAISKVMSCFDSILSESFGDKPKGVTAENLQSRIRGTILMAIANQKKHLLLSTGNKSELAVGYCTLYGDMNGGLSVIGDLYKTCIFELCEWIDSKSPELWRSSYYLPKSGDIIGVKIREKAPSAELRPGQFDTDSLPAYSVLDPILKSFIEKHLPAESLIKAGYEPKLIKQIESLLKNAEFKRRQAPPLLKVTNQAFGTGWRKPIASF